MELKQLYKELVDFIFDIKMDDSYEIDRMFRYEGKKFDRKSWSSIYEINGNTLEYYFPDSQRKKKKGEPEFDVTAHKFHLLKEYNSYGASGGNCWGDSAEDYHNDEPDNFDFQRELVLICEQFCPNIPYLKFMRALDGAINDLDRESVEYYGNYSNYKVIALDIHKLAENIYPYWVNSSSETH